ncbi:MAG: bifunctional [glutamine synthetase] adenylyltransferase/[glutamine synthetase]-adenylyl-L-tyrosine phosphorylase, partial [Candidatus Nanopelagicales bacterium]
MSASTPEAGQRAATVAGRLARLGFADAARGAQLASTSGLADVDWLDALADAADPDLALRSLVHLLEATKDDELLSAVDSDDNLRRRLVAVLGASEALGAHVARHPGHWHDLADSQIGTRPHARAVRTAMLAAVGADPQRKSPVAHESDTGVLDQLRVEYRRQLLGIAARDLTGYVLVDGTAADLSDLAAATLEAALAIARAEVGKDMASTTRLAVVAMGKLGGHELNYVSDVDVVYVAEPAAGSEETNALVVATRLASAMQRACSAVTAEGSIWEVDAALRPEGKAGPLVRTLASHVAYYERWASSWEFQALLKARPVAGDITLGAAYIDALAPLVWEAAARPDFVADVQAMRRRVEQTIPAREADRQLKLGWGGLRDVEFAVQLLQLVHGRGDVFLRSGTTLEALEALSTHGYVGRSDAAELDRAYRFMRTLEHRMQLQRLRRTHLVPEDDADLRRIARSMGHRSDPVVELTQEWRTHRSEVRRLHEKLFYRPLLQAVAQLDAGEARLTPVDAEIRLEALGYAGPSDALRHIEALTRGVSRRAAIQRTLLPVLMGWFAQYPDPDAGLLGFRRVSDALGATPWYLRLLRDSGVAAERLARVLATSRFATD